MMSEQPKHTPGPWRWKYSGDHIRETRDEFGRLVQTHVAADTPVEWDTGDGARVYLSAPPKSGDEWVGCTFVLIADEPPTKENAHLIAAAPQLLEACKARVDDWDRQTVPGAALEDVPDPPDVAIARAAIRAAEEGPSDE